MLTSDHVQCHHFLYHSCSFLNHLESLLRHVQCHHFFYHSCCFLNHLESLLLHAQSHHFFYSSCCFWKGEENNNSKQIMFKILWNQLPLYPLNRYCFCNCFICDCYFLWHKCVLKGQYHEVPRAALFTILSLEFWTYRCWKWFFFFLPAIKTEFFIEQIPPLLNSLF